MILGISVVTSCFNERDNLKQLIPAIRKVLAQRAHEIIVVDDSSSDGTIEVARQLADLAVSKEREGQTLGLARGMELAKYNTIITIDSDLENDPEWIPHLASKLSESEIVVASRSRLPRISERIFSKCYRRQLGVHDILSNYRAYRKSIITSITQVRGETFGAEFLIRAHEHGYRISEIVVEPSPRREKPGIGNTITANLRILVALLRALCI